MLKKTSLALAIALVPSFAFAAVDSSTSVSKMQSRQDVRASLSVEGVLHVSPVKLIRQGVYEAKILTREQGWTKVYVDARSGQRINDSLIAFRRA